MIAMSRAAILVLWITMPAWAQAAPVQQPPPIVDGTPQSCSDCHNGKGAMLPGAYELLPRSVHRTCDCTSCHESISMESLDVKSARPHGGAVEPVNCGECHEEEAETYVRHGRMEVGKDPDFPQCWDCHGSHDILPSSDRQSHLHPMNLQSTCRTCHTDVDLVKRHDVLRDVPIQLYQNSVHGQATRKGIYVSATCNDCHSAPDAEGKRTAHRILSPADAESPIFHFNIPRTCGQCHEPIVKDYLEGVHGRFLERGSVDTPVCTTCHGEHGIIRHDDPRSPVSAVHLAEQTCSPCHESAVLNQKYGLAGGRLASYIDSYHGLKSKAGDAKVANCASCHGPHRILPSSDPTSSIHPANLRATCGDCHPGISEQLAQTPIHATATAIHTGWAEFFRKFYIALIFVTIGLMLLHNLADWIRNVKRMGHRPFVQRLSIHEVMQHYVLMFSFIVLVITGFSLRFSEAWWVKLLFGWERGFEMRGIIHRVAAVIFVICSLWHVIYLCGARGRRALRDMMAGKRDLINLKENILFFLGHRKDKPSFGRFTYMEKCEYWALVWGAVIMTGTGALLWFDNYFVQSWSLPKGVLDVMLVIHYYEAWLATLAILVWHIYGTVFSPSAYPMNTAWLSGRMPADMYTHEHPEGPKLKQRIMRPRIEEELEASDQSAQPTPDEASVGEN
jgi:cytochrome b subunit of formate dehydrogenase